MSETEGRMTETKHAIVVFEADFLEDGEVAVCRCGWRSQRGTRQEAVAEHERHQAKGEPQ